jgi:hypothetical protein
MALRFAGSTGRSVEIIVPVSYSGIRILIHDYSPRIVVGNV